MSNTFKRDLPEMTIAEHHVLCVGVLALCHEHVPPSLQASIMEGLEAASAMGLDLGMCVVPVKVQGGIGNN